MTNVVGIGKGEKPCPYCGNPKPCPDFTCPRIAAVEQFDEGGWRLEFWPEADEPEPPAA